MKIPDSPIIAPLKHWDVPDPWRNILTSRISILLGAALSLLPTMRILWNSKFTLLIDNRETAIYYGALKHWLETGNLYNWTIPSAPEYGFTYPLFAAYILLPLTFFPTSSAASVFMVVVNVASGN